MVQQSLKLHLRRVQGFSTTKEKDSENINYESAIKGTTLDVYFFLLKKREAAGVREVQRELNLSSPSVASYHLEKLESLSIIRKNRFGNYELAKKVDIGALKQFILIGNYTLPRFSLYATFITIFFLGYLIFFLTFPLSVGEIFALIFGLFSVAICWIETFLCWNSKPF